MLLYPDIKHLFINKGLVVLKSKQIFLKIKQ